MSMLYYIVIALVVVGLVLTEVYEFLVHIKAPEVVTWAVPTGILVLAIGVVVWVVVSYFSTEGDDYAIRKHHERTRR